MASPGRRPRWREAGRRAGRGAYARRMDTTPSDAAAFWDGIAESYAARPVDDPEAFERKIALIRERMKPGDVVLDIGCGTGSLCLRLADAGREVHGLDLSEAMIRIARAKAEDQAVDNVHFHVGPFDEGFTAFGDASLDGICACSILHLVEDRAAFLAQAHRLLKPGGFFVASTVSLRESWVPYGALIGVMRWFGKAPRVVSSLSKADVRTAIEAAGFVDVTEPDVGAERKVSFVLARKKG